MSKAPKELHGEELNQAFIAAMARGVMVVAHPTDFKQGGIVAKVEFDSVESEIVLNPRFRQATLEMDFFSTDDRRAMLESLGLQRKPQFKILLA